MNTSGDAVDQIVRISLQGVEVAARISGAGAKHVAILLYTILKEQKQCKGKARLETMLSMKKELKIFTIQKKDLQKFTEEAKKYGVLYCVLKDRKNKDPNAQVDVIVKAEDAPRINRVIERFHLACVDTASIVTEVEKGLKNKEAPTKQEAEGLKEADVEGLLDDLMGKPMNKVEQENAPPVWKTEKAPSENTFGTPTRFVGDIKSPSKPSVKQELQNIKINREKKKTSMMIPDMGSMKVTPKNLKEAR